jgi:hypothetical protein
VELNREHESRFYNTAKGISDVHRVVVRSGGITTQKDSRKELKDLVLNQVKERKTKRSFAVREREHGAVIHVAQSDECQKCHHQVKKGESIDDWIQCEDCVRSWHKTCVGMDASMPMDEVEWSKCGNCGGADPEGESVVKRRKVATCSKCGLRVRGIDHAQCKLDKAQGAAAFRTPKATLLSRRDHAKVQRKKILPPKEKRASRKPRKLRKGKGRRVSDTEYQRLKALL